MENNSDVVTFRIDSQDSRTGTNNLVSWNSAGPFIFGNSAPVRAWPSGVTTDFENNHFSSDPF